jgi:cGMP-dependent protein kinase
VEEIVQKDLPENRKYMEQVSFFNFMNPEQKDSIAQGLISQKFSPGQDIVH